MVRVEADEIDHRPVVMVQDLAAVVRLHTRVAPVPFVPELRLHQATDPIALWETLSVGAADVPLPYWAFAWAGGRGLARYLLDHPETVRGKRVVDFGSGSGLVAIAAARAGAASVAAFDVDPLARAAAGLNAALADARLQVECVDLVGRAVEADVVLAGDIFYDRALTLRALPWLRGLVAAGAAVWVGDPGRDHRPREGLRAEHTFHVPVEAALESGTVKEVAILSVLSL